ncbi:hypothetical protein AB8807_11660 [Xanthomonas campestris pv. olitorii]|uniref:hypothetical protein n=1 Tax=Xanthomonas euvesicatoria TaxID=456327 RepID=UPI0026E42319|nr:hypothetical protein [Xanthomonas euvesicatoria]MDO7951227.1 hypothetical protein [Xanthomonas euvesicatoria pv. eucalypti]WVK02313.1 hypothetical protein KWH09_11625 [Xanthomonas campestris pv. olitorii]
MEGRCQSTERLKIFVLAIGLLLSLAACSKRSAQVDESSLIKSCDGEKMEVLIAISKNSEIAAYGSGYFTGSEVVFLWDAGPRGVGKCKRVQGNVRIIRSIEPNYVRPRDFILVEKIYSDSDAAFVQFHLVPTGKSGDVFLRKQEGHWRVTQKRLWES